MAISFLRNLGSVSAIALCNMASAPETPPAPAGETPATPAKAPKEKDVLNDMDSRRILATPEDAINYLARCQTDFADFGNYPVAAKGLTTDEEGGLVFDPELYTDETNVMVSVLTQRPESAGSTSTVKAIVIAPIPTLDAVLANEAAKSWLTRIMEKELNHVSVRQLRKAEDINDVLDTMPGTLEEYISSNRESGGALEAFEQLWRPIKNNLAKLSKPWKLISLSKKEMRRGLESKAYATENYPTLEETKSGSLFVFALQAMIQQAKKQGLDPSIFERWLNSRDEKTIDVKQEEDDEVSLEALMSAFEAPAEATPATDSAEGTTDASSTDTGNETPATGDETAATA